MSHIVSLDRNQAIQDTLNLVNRGFHPRSLLYDLALSVFPQEDPVLLGYWSGYCSTQFQGTHFSERRIKILENMIESVSNGYARRWFEGFQKDYNALTPH